MEIIERSRNATISAPGKLNQGCLLNMIVLIAGYLFPVFQVNPFNVQVPDEVILEPVFLISPQTRFAIPRQNIIAGIDDSGKDCRLW